MISLESLINPSDNRELRYRISRNIGVLLGKDKRDSEKIFSEIKQFYDLRSKIVHGGRKDIISPENILTLRYYVRESIKRFVKLGLRKDKLLTVLNTLGFGEIHTVKI